MQVRVAQSLGEQAVAEAVSGAGYPLTLDQYRGFEQGSMLPKRWHDFMTAYLQAMGLQQSPLLKLKTSSGRARLLRMTQAYWCPKPQHMRNLRNL